MIRILAAARTASHQVLRHPLRTLRVGLGFAAAVAVTIVPSAIIEGTRRDAVERAGELGTDLVEWRPAGSTGAERAPEADPREGDLAAIVAALGPGGDALAANNDDASSGPSRFASTAYRIFPGRNSDISGSIHLVGGDPTGFELRRTDLVRGAWPWRGAGDWAPADPRAPVEVVVEETLADLWSQKTGRDVIGQTLRIDWPRPGRDALPLAQVEWIPEADVPASGNRPEIVTFARVVGVVTDERRRAVDRFGFEKGRAFSDQVEDLLIQFGVKPKPEPWRASGMAVILPRSVVPGVRIDTGIVRIDPLKVGTAAKVIEELLTERGRRVTIATNAMLPVFSAPEIEGYVRLQNSLVLLFFVVGLGTLVGVSALLAWKRRGEIALRRAEGATRGDIFCEHAVESLLIALVGFALGVPLGYGLAEIRVALDPNVALAVAIPWAEVGKVGGALAIATFVSTAFPSWRASRVEPARLLRKASG